MRGQARAMAAKDENTPLLYERVVDHACADPGTLIRLSELRRAGDAFAYSKALEDLIETTLRKPTARLQRQPLFTWGQMESPCFRFELHRALMQHYDDVVSKAEKLYDAKDYRAAASGFLASADVPLRLVRNLQKWTALSPELRGAAPPFQLAFLLSLRAGDLCRAHHARFLEVYEHTDTGVETWKHGKVGDAQRQALKDVEEACRYCTLATLLWARPGGPLGVVTSASEFETNLQQMYYRTKSYCASTFQTRLDRAQACAASFADSQEVLALNHRLYYLTPDPPPPPPPAELESLFTSRS